MSACECGKTLGRRNTSGKCRSCIMVSLRADPSYEARRAEAYRKSLASDSELMARHVARSRASLAKWRDTPEGLAVMRANAKKATAASNTAENRAKRAASCSATRTGWCPADRRADYLKMRRHVGAAEAKRMILEDIANAERRRLAAMTPHERNMDRIRKGAGITTKPDLRKADPAFTLGGIASGAL